MDINKLNNRDREKLKEFLVELSVDIHRDASYWERYRNGGQVVSVPPNLNPILAKRWKRRFEDCFGPIEDFIDINSR